MSSQSSKDTTTSVTPMYRVRLYGGGVMGDIARQTLGEIGSVELVEESPDIIFAASYPRRITAGTCSEARLGAVNIHTSLLPEGRGYHPLNWALIWGCERTGITVHKIVDSFDAGDICLQRVLFIDPHETIVELRARVERIFPLVIRDFFGDPTIYLRDAMPQNQAGVSYAPKRRPEDSQLNLNAPARDIFNLWRSCHPDEYPAFVQNNGHRHIVDRVTPDGEIFYRE